MSLGVLSALALGRALRSFPDGCRLAFSATHPGHPLAEGPSVAITADDHQQLAHRLDEHPRELMIPALVSERSAREPWHRPGLAMSRC